MLNPQSAFGFSLGKPADDKTNPKPQKTSVSGDSTKPAAAGKSVPLGGKSTSSATSATASPTINLSNINAATTNQQTSAVDFGGKLPTNKVEGALKVEEQPKKQEGPPLSPFAQLKNDLFLYSKIQKGTLVQKDTQKLQKFFKILSDYEANREKSLQDLTRPQGKKYFQDIECLFNQTTDDKNWGIKFFVLIIEQLMHQIEYLSLNGALELLKRYIKINQNIFYVNGKFNKEFITKQCNLKILNQISSSVKSQPFFKKIVKEITFIKDLVFLEYHRFFKMLTSEQKQYQKIANNPILKSNKFFTNMGAITWDNFDLILKSQRKQIKNHFQLNIMLGILQAILHYHPKCFPQKFVNQKFMQAINDKLRLLQSSKQIKMNLFDQIFLHVLLIYPYSPQKPLKLYYHSQFKRYSYLDFFQNKPIILDNPIQNSGGRIFIQALLHYDQQYSQYPSNFQSYVFTSIYNILKDDPKRLWKDKNGYKQIISYISYLQATIQEYAQAQSQSQYKEYYDFYYVAICRFAKLINLLCYPSQNEFISPEKLVKNNFIIRDFIQKSFQIVKMSQLSKDYLLESLNNSRISTEPIYEFFHKLIIKDPNEYFNFKAQYNGDYQLQHEIFGNYLWTYALYGKSISSCILAFTRLIEYGASKEVSAIMQDLAIRDQYHQAQDGQGHQKRYSALEDIVKSLLRNNSNYIPLAKNILSIMKYLPNYNQSPWMQRLLYEFKDLPQKPHPQNISQYAVILEACLKFVQHSPKSVSKVQQFFNFKFANRFLCHILEISIENKQIYNKYMRCAQYQPISIAVKLLKTMTELYRKQKDSNLGQLVPYQIRQLLQSQNKDGTYQIIMRNTAISYHLALITLLLSKQLKFDSDLNSLYPNLKNQILQTLINLNYINLDLKHQNSLKVAILYNKQQEDQLNKAINIKDELYEAITNDPTYLGFQYLISAGSIDSKQKIKIFSKIGQIQLQENFSNMCSRSHFLYLYWKQIQNSKLCIQNDKGWQHVKAQMEKLQHFLDKFKMGQVRIDDLTLEDKDSLNQILKNIYDFSNLLKSNNPLYYTKFFAKYHTLFLSITLNKYFIINDENLSYSQSYRDNLLTFFGCKTFLTNKQFFQLAENKNNVYQELLKLILGLINLTYRKNYNIRNDNLVLQILEFALSFLIQINKQDQHNLQDQIRYIRQQFTNRPHKITPMLTKQIIILVLLNSQLSEKIECDIIDFGSKDWLLMMNAVVPNKRYSSILMTELFNIYEMHPIFFASTCHYLAETAKTALLEEIYEVQYYKNKKSTVNTLIDVLKKSIQAQKSFHVIWVIQVLIEIFMNKTINYHARQKYCSDLRIGILTLSLLHERISQLLSKVGSPYSTNYTNIWKCKNINGKKTSSKSTFSEKQQLLAYFRLITFINFMKEQEKTGLIIDKKKSSECTKIENEIMQSCLRIIPLLGNLLKDERTLVQADINWEKKVKLFQISKISTKTMQSSGIKQLSSQQASQIWKDKSGLELLNEVSNFQLTSLVVLWVSRYHQNLQVFENQEFMQNNVQSFLKFLQALKVKLSFMLDNSKQTDLILKFISNKIYLGSVEVSKEMLFTNMQSLSSSLSLNYEQIKGKMLQSFILLYTLTMSIMKSWLSNKNKIEPRLIKLADHLYRSSSQKLKPILDKPGEIPFETPPGYENRSDMSFTKTRTMWSQRF